MIAIREILHREEFDRLEPDWRGLLAAGAPATLFQSWAWQRSWLDHLAPRASMRALVFMDWREVVAIAPLVVRRAHGLPLRRLQWVGTGVSDYLDLLVRPGHEAPVLRAFAGYVESRASRHWDAVDLHQLRPGSPCIGGLPGQPEAQSVAPYRPLPGTVEEFQSQLGKKLRGNLRYSLRALERDHSVEFALASGGDLDAEMSTFFDLHARRWRTRWQPGVLFGRAVQSFHRQAARDLLEEGSLRLHALRLDGKTIASLYCFAVGGVGYYYLGGFDPALSRHGVGTLLTARAMEDAVREGCREFDFLRGREPYKYRWGCIDRTNHRVVLPGRGPLAACAPRALKWEQQIVDRYESRAHGSAHAPVAADGS